MKLKFSNWKWLTAYGVLLFLVFLLINIPADVVWSLIPQQYKRGLIVSNLQGNAWSARAENVIINNYELGRANWTLNPLLLLTGKLGGHLTVRNAMGQAQSHFTVQADQLVELSDLSGEFNAALLDPILRPLTLTGAIKSELTTLLLQPKLQLTASGILRWNNATVTGVQEVALGNILLNASPQNKGTLLRVSNEGGLIDIGGDIRVTGNGRYNLNLLLTNRNKNRSDIDDMLLIIGGGRRDSEGRVRFTYQGALRF